MGDVIRWGILATGGIAQAFAADLALIPEAEVVAVGSRSRRGAERFAARFGVPAAYASYVELAADPTVDVVYVASPHALHHEHVRMLLEAGKPVLCEKAMTIAAWESQELFDLAARRRLFLMEAMWMACHPLIRHLRERLRCGDFGEPRQLVADLGFLVERPPTDRLLDPTLGGGALLDMGVYVLTLAHLLLGEPEQITAVAHRSVAGADLNTAIALGYRSGAVAALTATMTAHSTRAASLATDRGRLEIAPSFQVPPHAVWIPYAGGVPQAPERIDPPAPVIGSGLGNEAVEVIRCLRAGRLESPLVPHAQTLTIMRQMDEIRAQIGVRYAADARDR